MKAFITFSFFVDFVLWVTADLHVKSLKEAASYLGNTSELISLLMLKYDFYFIITSLLPFSWYSLLL